MVKESNLKEFAKYSVLNILGMIGLSCYIMADTFFVSKALGAKGLTALNIAIPVFSFISGCGLMIGMGGGIRYGLYNSDKEKGKRIFTNAFSLCLGIALILVVLGIGFSRQIARLLGADDSVFAMTKTYMQMILIFAPMFMMNNLLLSFVRNDGAPQLAMAGMLLGSLSNIILDWLFMFPMGMGMFGAVLATCIAPIISMLVLSPFFIKKRNNFALVKCRIKLKSIRGICTSGLPSLVTELSAGLVMIIFNILILGLEGNIGVAAYGVVANISLVLMAVYSGLAQGMQPIVSKNFGRGKDTKVLLKYGIITVLGISLIACTGIFVFAEGIAGIFNSEGNMELQRIAVEGLRLYFLGAVFAGLNIVLAVYFTATDNAKPGNIISLLRGFVVIVPMAFVLSALFGMTGVWLTFLVTEMSVGIVGGRLLS